MAIEDIFAKICTGCQPNCCNNCSPYVTNEEKKKIVKTTGKQKTELFNGNCISQNSDNACCFNVRNKGCKIYDIRPFDCCLYPFDIIKYQGKDVWIVYNCIEQSKTEPKKLLEELRVAVLQNYASGNIEEYSALGPILGRNFKVLADFKEKA